MEIVIIEDEPLLARNLQKLVERVEPEARVMATLHSLAEAQQWFETHPEPDLLLMDIQLSDGVSFDLFGRVALNCPVIFTTAYNEYAIRAFKVNSVDYLLKPIDATELKAAIGKYRKMRGYGGASDFGAQVAALLKAMKQTEAKPLYRERFMVHYKNSLMPVPVEKIAYFVKDELIYLITTDNQRLVTDYDALEEVEHQVNPDVFFRANRQYILRLAAVAHFKAHYNGKLLVRLHPPLPVEVEVSREKAAEFKKWLGG